MIDVYGSKELISDLSPLSGNGKWDVLGGEIWVMNGNINDWRTDGIYYSTGGDYALVIPAHEVDKLKSGSKPAIGIELWESDPGPVNFPNYYIA